MPCPARWKALNARQPGQGGAISGQGFHMPLLAEAMQDADASAHDTEQVRGSGLARIEGSLHASTIWSLCALRSPGHPIDTPQLIAGPTLIRVFYSRGVDGCGVAKPWAW